MSTLMPLLGVNVDHIATIRQARRTPYPDVATIACLLEAKQACDSITVHLREDRRHIQKADVYTLREKLTMRLNLEMAPTTEMLAIALEAKPHSVCLVPEKRQELTTEGGLAVDAMYEQLKPYIATFKAYGIAVSLFIEPRCAIIKTAHTLGVDAVELHTGLYANASDDAQRISQLNAIQQAADYGSSLNLQVNAGHGLTTDNVKPLAAIKTIHEFNIGHAIVADALVVGIVQAARHMKQCLRDGRHGFR